MADVSESKKPSTHLRYGKWTPVFDWRSEEDKVLQKPLSACSVTINGQKIDGPMRGSKNYAKVDAVLMALKQVFNADTSELERQLLEAEFLGPKSMAQVFQELATQHGVKVEQEVAAEGEPAQGNRRFQHSFSASGHRKVVGPWCASKKEARNSAVKLALVGFFKVDKDLVEKSYKKQNESMVSGGQVTTKTALLMLNELVHARQGQAPKSEVLQIPNPLGKEKMLWFRAKIEVGGQVFEGEGNGKKQAKQLAAEEALKTIFGIRVPKQEQVQLLPTAVPAEPVPVIADYIAEMVAAKFQQISDSAPGPQGSVMAAFVVTTGKTMDEAFVVSVATGTKCVSGGKLSVEGRALHDCHAEVMARRGLILFFYKQLELMLTNKNDSIFMLLPTGGYRLKDDVKVHLFISSPPCGDARIYAMSSKERLTSFKNQGSLRVKMENGVGTIPVKSPNVHPVMTWDGLSGGQRLLVMACSDKLLRVKMENGVGTIPVKSPNVHPVMTWDGLSGGQRLLVMACSDKLLRWNILGLQGALLSHYVEPIYLDTIVIGSLYEKPHMIRACWGRVARMRPAFPAPFLIKEPLVSGVSNPRTRTTAKPPDLASNWTAVTPTLEIINQETGLNPVGEESRVSKRALFNEFLQLYHQCSALVPRVSGHYPQTYRAAKLEAAKYNTAKGVLKAACIQGGLGQWVQKPPEMEDFELAILKQAPTTGTAKMEP